MGVFFLVFGCILRSLVAQTVFPTQMPATFSVLSGSTGANPFLLFPRTTSFGLGTGTNPLPGLPTLIAQAKTSFAATVENQNSLFDQLSRNAELLAQVDHDLATAYAVEPEQKHITDAIYAVEAARIVLNGHVLSTVSAALTITAAFLDASQHVIEVDPSQKALAAALLTLHAAVDPVTSLLDQIEQGREICWVNVTQTQTTTLCFGNWLYTEKEKTVSSSSSMRESAIRSTRVNAAGLITLEALDSTSIRSCGGDSQSSDLFSHSFLQLGNTSLWRQHDDLFLHRIFD